MTYRVTRLVCGNCDRIKRVKILVGEFGEVYPRCDDCGRCIWKPEAQESSFDELTNPSIMFGVATDFELFMKAFNERQSEYIRKQYLSWLEDRAQEAEQHAEVESASLQAMYRELWEILDSE